VRLARRHAPAAAAAVVLAVSLAPALLAATPVPRRDGLAAAIEQRLNAAGHLTYPMTRSAGYFEGDPIQPQRAFGVWTGGTGRGSFSLAVVVYRTAAQAAAMDERDVAHVRELGGDFHAFEIVRAGRVLYMASTAPAPDPRAPAVPVKAFLALVALADAHV
jgi:hypothetical protein